VDIKRLGGQGPKLLKLRLPIAALLSEDQPSQSPAVDASKEQGMYINILKGGEDYVVHRATKLDVCGSARQARIPPILSTPIILEEPRRRHS
jgi:hypothetical protein